jgi:hypothetical protein
VTFIAIFGSPRVIVRFSFRYIAVMAAFAGAGYFTVIHIEAAPTTGSMTAFAGVAGGGMVRWFAIRC